VYTTRKVDTAALRALSARLPAAASDAARARALADEFGTVAPKFVQLTGRLARREAQRVGSQDATGGPVM
jgi:hypothetical protein